MGLNESYAHARSQVLMQIPVPNVNQAYAMIINVESQRMHGASNGFSSTEVLSETTLMSNRMTLGSQSGNSGYYNNSGTSSGSGGGASTFSNGGNNGGYRNRNYVDGRNNYSTGRPQLYCEFCHYKGHTKETCYKLHGYPKKKGGTPFHANNASASSDSGVFDSSVSSNARGYDSSTNSTSTGAQSTQGMSMFTHEQYNQILQMLRKGKDKEMDTMANVATAGTSGIITALMTDMTHANWIIDTGASNHMVHNFSLMSRSKNLDVKGNMKVNLPTGDQVSISHVGESLVLKDKMVKDVLFIPEFKYNLLSVSQLTKQLGCAVVFFS